MSFYIFLLTLCFSAIYVFGYTDPSIAYPNLVERFEYKLSFKGPHLAFKDGTVPFWDFGGSAIASDEQVRITPSIRSQRGWIWSKNTISADNWHIDVKLRITGRGRIGADGMAIWFTEKTGMEGSVFGSNDQWNGLGIFLDSFDNDALSAQLQNNPIIAVMVNDGSKSYDHQHDGSSQIQGSCIKDFRNKPLPIRLKVEYINRALTVYVNNGISQDDNAFEFCTRIDNIVLPKVGHLGVTAATGGLADDHDVLEFLTYVYSDKQTMAQNQAANEEQARKYQEEYEKYEQELRKQKADYQKDHPDATTPISDQQIFESEYDREFRVILEGQDQIRLALTNVDRKMAELLGRVERLASTPTGQTQVGIGTGAGVPADVARVQDVNRVINANTDMSRSIQGFAQILTDLQQKVNNLQANLNRAQPTGGTAQPVASASIDSKALEDVREIVRQIKSETNAISQRQNQVTCPTVVGAGDSSCMGPFIFFVAIAIQTVILLGYFMFKNRNDHYSRKYL